MSPYKHSDYIHHRLKSPDAFIKGSFRTVNIFLAKRYKTYQGKKFLKQGNLARVGINKVTHKYEVQSILEAK